MLDPYACLIEDWLAAAPHLSAVDILVRLREHAPSRFGKGQLRTVQRVVKRWRAKTAHQLINGAEVMIRIEPTSIRTLAILASKPAHELKRPQRQADIVAGE